MAPAQHAATVVDFTQIHSAARIGRDRVNVVELSGTVPAVAAEESDELHLLPVDDLDFLVASVGHKEVLLIFVGGERDIETRALTSSRLALNINFVDERAVELESLNSVIHTIADVDDPIVGHGEPVDQIELR